MDFHRSIGWLQLPLETTSLKLFIQINSNIDVNNTFKSFYCSRFQTISKESFLWNFEDVKWCSTLTNLLRATWLVPDGDWFDLWKLQFFCYIVETTTVNIEETYVFNTSSGTIAFGGSGAMHQHELISNLSSIGLNCFNALSTIKIPISSRWTDFLLLTLFATHSEIKVNPYKWNKWKCTKNTWTVRISRQLPILEKPRN